MRQLYSLRQRLLRLRICPAKQPGKDAVGRGLCGQPEKDRDGDDTVVLSKPKGRLHLFDLPLYRRKDGSYVLHRVVNFGSDGSYTMCGDNQFAVEKGITDDDVIGVVTAFYRKGKPYTVDSMKYRAYLEFMFYSKPLRKVIASTVSRSKNAFSKLKTKKGKK